MHLVVLKWDRLRPISLLPAALRRHFTRLHTDSTRELTSPGRRRPLEPNETAHIIDQVHHADLHSRPRHTNGTHEYAAHPVFLIRKNVLDAGAHPRAGCVGGLLALRQRMVAGTPTMYPALVALLLELGFHLRRPVGTIGPHLIAGIGFVQNLIELLAIVDGGVGLGIAANDLVFAVDADVVLVAIEALVVLLGPARVLILLRILSRLFFPSLRRLARLDGLVLFPGVMLLGCVDNGGIDNLPTTGEVTLRIEVPIEALK